MKLIGGIIKKEILLLVRDLPGLIILFVMPTVLIFVITGTQENAFRSLDNNSSAILFVDEDHDSIGVSLEKGLEKSNYFSIVTQIHGKTLTAATMNEELAAGNFQVGILIKKGATKQAMDKAYQLITANYDSTNNVKKYKISSTQNDNLVCIYYDPACRDSYRNAISTSLMRLIQSVELNLTLKAFFNELPGELNTQLQKPIRRFLLKELDKMELMFTDEIKKRFGDNLPADFKIDAQPRHVDLNMTEDLKEGIQFKYDVENANIINAAQEYAHGSKAVIKPTIVQNNVPAFALFAMFFIVIPLAGSLISEKTEGSYNRIRTLPVKYITILWGKTIVYLGICLLQLLLMIVTGMYLLPMLYGMPALELGTNYFSLILATFASGLAAVGFGLLMGTFANTQSQAGMFGAFIVIILGILGGIFLPVYMMPAPIQAVSIISPIRWGIDSFLDIFVRNAGINEIAVNITRLGSFFIVSFFIATLSFIRRK
jgi:ABC-2 type transport system permease protein